MTCAVACCVGRPDHVGVQPLVRSAMPDNHPVFEQIRSQMVIALHELNTLLWLAEQTGHTVSLDLVDREDGGTKRVEIVLSGDTLP